MKKAVHFVSRVVAGLILLGALRANAYEIAFAENFPDPDVIAGQDGNYYAYATQGDGIDTAGRRSLNNIQVIYSTDLSTWTRLPDALPVKPVWASAMQNFWAPDVTFHDGLYYMYFAAEPNTHDGFCLGVATSSAPAGPFRDAGAPVICGPGISDIDPAAFDDPSTGSKLLYYGSGYDPIREIHLTENRLHRDERFTDLDLIKTSDRPYERLVEGAWISFHEGYYYLFYSGDNCCFADPHYAVRAARSRHAEGPFEKPTDPEQGVVAQAQDGWLATGHNAIVVDKGGQEWIYMHAIDAQSPELDQLSPTRAISTRVLIRARLVYRDGWPTVE